MTEKKLYQAQPPKANADLLECFRPVAKRFGRPMFELIMNSGIASEATQILGQANQQVPRLQHATGQLAQAYNAVAKLVVEQHGWTVEELAECEREIKLAWAKRIVLPESNLIVMH